METVDVVVVNHNSTDSAIEAIESVKHQTNGIIPNIVVVDNASSDQPERLTERFPDIRLVSNRDNLGYSRAINKALQKCSARYAVIMNPDTIVLNGFLAEIIHFLDNHRNVGIVGPRIFDPDGSIQGSARRFPTACSYAFGRKSPLTKLFPNNPLTKKEFLCFDCNGDEPVLVDWVSGACMVIRRKALDSIGGFDKRFFLYWEDTDVCKRIKQRGWRVVYYPKAKIKHIVGVSSKNEPLKAIWHLHYSCYKLLEKHATWPFRIFIVPVAFSALALRCAFVVLLNIVNRKLTKKSV